MERPITLWRAVDHEGEVLESYVTKRRDRKAALKFLRKAMKRYGPARMSVVTDLLRSYGAAMKVVGNADRQETGRWLNNQGGEFPLAVSTTRARHAALPTNAKSAESSSAVHASVHNHFNQERHLYSRRQFQAQPNRRSC